MKQRRKEEGFSGDSTFIRQIVISQLKAGVVNYDHLEAVEEANRDLREEVAKWKEMHNEVAAENRELGELNRDLQKHVNFLLDQTRAWQEGDDSSG